VALFARVEVQVSELAREFTTQATALIEVVYSLLGVSPRLRLL